MVVTQIRRDLWRLVIFGFILVVGADTGLISQEILVSDNSGIESELSITINPNDPTELIVTSMRTTSPIQVFSSSDSGLSWQQSTTFNDGLADPVVTYGDNDTAYLTYLDFGASLELYLAESMDNGANWTSKLLVLDSLAADRQWIKRDNSSRSPFYGNIYIGYFHPQMGPDIHFVEIAPDGTVGPNQSVQSTNFPFVQNCALDITDDGEIVICFLSQHADNTFNIMSVNSTDGSNSFSSEVLVSPIHMYLANGNPVTDVVGFAPGASSRLQNSLQMAIDKSNGPNRGRVYLTWTDFEAGNPQEGMNVYISYSDNRGGTWSAPQIVNDDGVPSSHQYFSGVTVNPNGVLVVSWYDRRSDPLSDSLTDFYLAYSLDGGASFEPSLQLNSESSDHNAVTNGLITFGVGEYTTVAASETHAFAVWADGRSNDGNMAIYLNRVELPDLGIKGDLNMDGAIDLLDVAPFIAALASGEFVSAADISCDGSVNLLDVAPFVDLLSG
ncbi:MAG: dockerin type I domain-containing protein, partial [Planctomycetota bacterium]